MTYFSGKQAIVTGAGSGIGAALSRALVAAGADVLCTDVDADAAERTAKETGGPGTATSARLDVTDAGAVQAVVDDVVARAGRLDLMFNNAGHRLGRRHRTADAGPVERDHRREHPRRRARHRRRLPGDDPARTRPHRQHRVDGGVGSAAGRLTSYAMTKHAVVGLSQALRSEAAARGVNVLAVCPGAVETPILDKGAVGDFEGRSFFLTGMRSQTGYDPDRLAQDVLRAIERKRGILVVPKIAYAGWLFVRLAPSLMQRASARMIARRWKSK